MKNNSRRKHVNVTDTIDERDLGSLEGLIAKLQGIKDRSLENSTSTTFQLEFGSEQDFYSQCEVYGYRLNVHGSRLESDEEMSARVLAVEVAKKASDSEKKLRAKERYEKNKLDEIELFKRLSKKYKKVSV